MVQQHRLGEVVAEVRQIGTNCPRRGDSSHLSPPPIPCIRAQVVSSHPAHTLVFYRCEAGPIPPAPYPLKINLDCTICNGPNITVMRLGETLQIEVFLSTDRGFHTVRSIAS
jgi:hypothetical protein